MNVPRFIYFLSAALIGLSIGTWAAAAEPKAGVPEVRAAVTKGLGFLAREGEVWMEKKNCNGCHHLPELLWSHRLAMERGFPVDAKKLEEWITWADQWTPEPEGPKQKEATEELALRMLAMPERPAEKLAHAIVSSQKEDGSWKPAGQFAEMQARGNDAKANSTRMFLLALAAPKPAESAGEARAKAAAFLAKTEPAKSVDTLVYRLLYAQRFGIADEVSGTRKELLKLQRGDGGWSWVIGVNASDPLATGEVLHTLAVAPDTASAAATEKAKAWLLAAQLEDGSWFTDFSRISKLDRSAPEKASSFKQVTEIYHYWGSAWATIGLLQTLPAEK
jgi:hypothetical protein